MSKEKKIASDIKRRTLCINILKHMQKTFDNSLKTGIDIRGAFEQSIVAGDIYITRLIKSKPQDKMLILSAGYKVRDELKEFIKEQQNKRKKEE